MGKKPPQPEPSPSVRPDDPDDTDEGGEDEDETYFVHFSPVSGYKKNETQVLKLAEKIVNDSIKSSECVENFLIHRDMVQTEGRTSQEVIDDLRSKHLTVPVHMYYRNSKVVGYRNPPYPDVYTNRKFHAGASACSRASNLGHETIHVAGYGHDFKATKRRPYSVPYSYNAAISECCTCHGVLDCVLR